MRASILDCTRVPCSAGCPISRLGMALGHACRGQNHCRGWGTRPPLAGRTSTGKRPTWAMLAKSRTSPTMPAKPGDIPTIFGRVLPILGRLRRSSGHLGQFWTISTISQDFCQRRDFDRCCAISTKYGADTGFFQTHANSGRCRPTCERNSSTNKMCAPIQALTAECFCRRRPGARECNKVPARDLPNASATKHGLYRPGAIPRHDPIQT